ncbi:MAG: glycosyltransferase [Geminicoccaceae bacterium]
MAEIARKYGLDADRIGLLPTPVRLPPEPVKAATPTVISVGRWDRRKRPERFIELARAMPAIRFVAIGRSRDPAYEAELRARAAGIANLELAGFIDQFASDALERRLAAAWVLVNTAGREGLPTAFLEALAHGCALLAEVDPGGITSRFGEAVADGDFRAGLERLLSGDAWRAKGAAGRRARRRQLRARPRRRPSSVALRAASRNEAATALAPVARGEAGLNILILCYEYPPLGGGERGWSPASPAPSPRPATP